MWRRAIKANSAAVKRPKPATSSPGGVVHGAAEPWLRSPASARAPSAASSAIDEESCPGRRRAWCVLKTPTTATSRNGCVIASRMSRARLAQAEALHLAAGRERQLVDEVDLPWHLVIGHVLAAPRDEHPLVDGVAATRHHIGLRHLAQA